MQVDRGLSAHTNNQNSLEANVQFAYILKSTGVLLLLSNRRRLAYVLWIIHISYQSAQVECIDDVIFTTSSDLVLTVPRTYRNTHTHTKRGRARVCVSEVYFYHFQRILFSIILSKLNSNIALLDVNIYIQRKHAHIHTDATQFVSSILRINCLNLFQGRYTYI